MIWIPVLVLLVWSRSVGDGANILVIVPTPAFSHQQFYRAYVEELHRRGHQLTVVTPNPRKDTNLVGYREIDLSYVYDYFKKTFDVSSKDSRKNYFFAETFFVIFAKVINDICHITLSDPNLSDLYKRNEKFDLFVVEWGLFGCYYPFEKLADGKMIGISSFELGAVIQNNLGGAWNPSFAADSALEYSDRMTFFQRLRSFVYYWNNCLFLMWLRAQETNIARQYLGPDIKSVSEIEKRVALVFDSSHVTMSYPRPNNINFIPLGGPAFHLNGRKLKPLPKDIKAFVDDAPDGVIYFSLGTNVKTHNMSTREEDILMQSFGRIKQKVLWKWDNEDLKVDLRNVMKRKWFPQVDVLAHPNVKAFVTQAGLQSIGEAIEYHVPMIVMPFFADQSHNAKKLELEGVALHLDYDQLNVEDFSWALNEIVSNKKYKKNIERLSALVKDQPIPPLEKAVWWTEYIIRHNGAPHLRSAASTMPWYQYYLLDVLAFLFVCIYLVLYAIYFTAKTLMRLLLTSKKSKKD